MPRWKQRNFFIVLLICALGISMLAFGRSGEGKPKVDTKTEVLEADRAFYRETKAKGLEGWMSFMAEDAVRISPLGQKAFVGKGPIRELDKSLFEDPKTNLVWEPSDGGGFADPNWGFTTGKAKLVRKADDGSESVDWTGAYITVWHKNEKGQWKVILDTGGSDEKGKKD